MKKVVVVFLICLFSLAITFNGFAQAPPPPPPDHGASGNQNGGNAPVGSGIFILLSFAATYGAIKFKQKGKEGINI